MGARLRCASATIWTICESRVSAPTRSARMISDPVPFTVAPMTLSPAAFSTGIGSPVSMASSTELDPSTTVPSTGTFSPGRIRSRSPGRTRSRGTSSSLPSSLSLLAVLGARPNRALIAALVCPRAFSSRTCPRSTRVTITAAASKYTPTSPASLRKDSGKNSGKSDATRLKT